MSNAIIIGCGYVGQPVAKLWSQHATVTATTTTPNRVGELESVAQRVVVLHGNDAAQLRSLLQDQTTVLLSVGASRSTPEAYEETYLETAKTLVAVLPDTPTVRQVIYTGSYAVYGDQGGAWVDEAMAIAPTTRKAEILAETEQVLLAARGVHVCVLRLGGIYGPGREIVRIFRRAAGTTRPGTGEEAANWVHLDDIVGAIEFARQHQLQGIYNLVCDVPVTTRALLDRVCRDHDLAPVTWDPTQSSDRAYNARVSNRKLRAAGYQFIHPEISETG